MSSARWNATIIDSPDTEPWAVVGDLVVAVRTPRSRDFVTVEVASATLNGSDLVGPSGVFLSPSPYPCLNCQWHGEVRLGAAVGFQVAGESYRLTLLRLSEGPGGAPWIRCDICIERD